MFRFALDRLHLSFDVFQNFLMQFKGVLFRLVGLLAATFFAHLNP